MISKISTLKLKDYLKTVILECSKWSIGQMDENQDKAIALYANRRQLEDNSKYKKLKSYGILPITLLLRWTKNYNVDDYNCSIECLYNGPIDLGADENNVYKFSIEFNLLYRKGENNGN